MSRQRGFTLVELLVVMAVMSILSLTLANFITNWLQASSLAQKRTALLADAERTLDLLTADVRLSGSVDQVNRWPDDNSPSGQFGWQSNSQTVILAKIATTSNNDVIFSDPAKYITQKDNQIYYLSGGTLYRRTLASDSASDNATTTCPAAEATPACPADTVVAGGVSSLSFTYYDANNQISTVADARSVQASITLSSKLNSKTITATYKTRMVFRNE